MKGGKGYKGRGKAGKGAGRGGKGFVNLEGLEVRQGILDKYDDGSVYEGGIVSSEGKDHRHGKGRMTYPDGNYYDGGWMDDMKHGEGVDMYFGAELRGTWKNNKVWGYARKTFPDGRVVEGTYKNGKLDGHGESTWEDGTSFKGDHKDGKRHGLGTMVVLGDDGKERYKYEGQFVKGKQEGSGEFWDMQFSATLDRVVIKHYKGDFRGGVPHGEGMMELERHWCYRGCFVNGKRHGEGEQESFNPQSGRRKVFVKGTWTDDTLTGPCAYNLYLEGGLVKAYEVDFKDGKPNGNGRLEETRHGVVILVYEGDFKGWRFEGSGRVERRQEGEPSTTYEGEFRNGLFHGKGKTVSGPQSGQPGSTDEACSYEGEWVMGRKEGYGKMVYSNLDVYEGPFRASVRETPPGSDQTGTLTSSDGSRWYRGEWQNNRRHGKGTLTELVGEQKNTYEGSWINGEQNGWGEKRRYTTDGLLVYKGDFVNGHEDGQGELFKEPDIRPCDAPGTGTLQRKYKGAFKAGVYHGNGLLCYEDGNYYEGNFKGGKKSGHGKEVAGEDGTYVGRFEDGRKHGRGTLEYPWGAVYEGEFHHGVMHGVYMFTILQGASDSSGLGPGRYRMQFDGGKKVPGSLEVLERAAQDGQEAAPEEEEEECSVCFGPVNALLLPCMHRICTKCEQLLRQRTCPLCRADIEEVLVEPPPAPGAAPTDEATRSKTVRKNLGDGRWRVEYARGNVVYEGEMVLIQEKLPHKPIRHKLIRHGKGRETLSSGKCYDGMWVDGKKEGYGVETTGHTRYEGSFLRGLKHDHGHFWNYEDGGEYEGDWYEGKKSGWGRKSAGDGAVYEGEFCNGRIHGSGRMRYPAGATYDGDWVDGQPHGQGVFIGVPRETQEASGEGLEQIREEGNFVRGRLTGQGRRETSKCVYTGEFVNGKFHGQGVLKDMIRGTLYEGEFVDGRKEGHGTFREEYFEYKGSFRNNVKEGFGIQTCIEPGKEATYEGEWRAGRRCGQGVLQQTTEDGTTFEGTFEDGELVHGKATYSSGNRYEGGWRNGARHGEGKYVTDQYIYEGEWQDGNRHGRGITRAAPHFGTQDEATWSNGKRNGRGQKTRSGDSAVLIGTFVDNNLEGHGIIHFKDGSTHKGEFRAGKRHGRGKYTRPPGTGPSFEGAWVDDLREGPGKTIFHNGSVISASFERDVAVGPATIFDQHGTVTGTGIYSDGGRWTRDRAPSPAP
eukprot:Hpha_TRINITY_DN15896_c2_g13::TRINITY_DN15896_c2_g13_i1::g.191952::m.191952